MNVPGGGGKPFAVVGCSLSGHKKLCVWGLSSEGEGVRVSYWVLNRVGLGVLDKPGWKGAEVSSPPPPPRPHLFLSEKFTVQPKRR